MSPVPPENQPPGELLSGSSMLLPGNTSLDPVFAVAGVPRAYRYRGSPRFDGVTFQEGAIYMDAIFPVDEPRAWLARIINQAVLSENSSFFLPSNWFMV